MGNYKVITLCGSTRFKNTFQEIQKQLALAGWVVLSPSVFSHTDGELLTEDMITMLKEMHKQKIDMSDEIFVINVDGYIGDTTKSEIEYAESKGIQVRYLVKPHDVTNTPRTNKVLYLCDQKACKNCSYPECRHTHDIEHAINFDNVSSFNASLEPLYVENARNTIYLAPARGNGKTDKLIKWLKGD